MENTLTITARVEMPDFVRNREAINYLVERLRYELELWNDENPIRLNIDVAPENYRPLSECQEHA